MIPSSQTNLLYLADSLSKDYPDFYQRFEKLMGEHNVQYKLLPDTKDIWARDYMPVQISRNKFIQFVYDPKYLKFKKYANTISDTDEICRRIDIKTIKSDIVLDGGNVGHNADKVILTNRIFEENPKYSKTELLNELKRLFEVDKIFLIPQQPGDFTGHADGMVSFVDENTILINDYKDENKLFMNAFEIAIHNTGLNVIKIPYQPEKSGSSAKGIYINYLEMEKLIILPVFGIKEDDEAIRQFEKIFSGKKPA